MKTITVAEKYITYSPVNGNPSFDQTAYNYASNLLNWGCSRVRIGEDICVEITNNIPFDSQDFLYTTQVLLGSVTGYRGILGVKTLSMDDITPDFLPNRVIENWDESEDPIRLPDTYKTWNEWVGRNYTKTQIGEYTYFCSNAGGIDLTNEQLLEAIFDANIEFSDSIPVIEETL